jgi:hypothetical protein
VKKFIAFLTLVLCVSAESAHAFGGTIMLAGDSWALIPCIFNSPQGAIRMENIPADVVACQSTTGLKVHASSWMTRKEYSNVLSILKSRRDVNVIYLSLGGNDFLEHWNKNMTPQQEQDLDESIRHSMETILKNILAVRPDFRILISGYDYPRFFSAHNDVAIYKKFYERAGSPSVLEMNQALQRYTLEMLKLADHKRVFYIHHLGLGQYYHGNKESGLQPGKTLPPAMISSPDHPERFGGDVSVEQDVDAMLGLPGIIDSYHLSPLSFVRTFQHSIQHYLRDWMMED